jgi:NAD(P)-dependent dehydrogenase (short-subunit alcohol dehydrogenase family)
MSGNGALQGQSALVTGGAGGLGSASAIALARDGAAITLMGRTEKKLEEAAQKVRAAAGDGAAVQYVVGDALLAADVAAAVASAAEFGGGLHIAVGVVGGGTIAPLLAMDEGVFLEDLRRNIVGAFLLVKHATPVMKDNGGGSIVCISSDAATMSWPFMTSYCAGKAGLDAFVRVAADELGCHDIRVNAVRPGLTKSDDNANVSMLFSDPEIIADFVAQKPLGRTGRPSDIAAGVRFLAGPESSWVTGQSLAIEGGNELRKAPSLEKIARARLGDGVVDTALAGRIP